MCVGPSLSILCFGGLFATILCVWHWHVLSSDGWFGISRCFGRMCSGCTYCRRPLHLYPAATPNWVYCNTISFLWHTFMSLFCACRLSSQLCLEYMVNHISPASPQFQDYLQHGEASRFSSMFVKWRDIWPTGKSDTSASRHCRAMDSGRGCSEVLAACC